MIKKGENKAAAVVVIGPTVFWLMLFLMLPLFLVIGISFMQNCAFGGVVIKFCLDAYKGLFHAEYLGIFGNSLKLSFLTTIICLLIGYPFAFVIARADKKWKPILVMMVMLPFWINSMIRI